MINAKNDIFLKKRNFKVPTIKIKYGTGIELHDTIRRNNLFWSETIESEINEEMLFGVEYKPWWQNIDINTLWLERVYWFNDDSVLVNETNYCSISEMNVFDIINIMGQSSLLGALSNVKHV